MRGDHPYAVSLIRRFGDMHTGTLELRERPSTSATPAVVVSTMHTAGLDDANGLFVLADGTILACCGNSISVRVPSKLQVPFATFAGYCGWNGFEDGKGCYARFYAPRSVTIDKAGNIVVVDCDNNALRLVSQEGIVSTLAGSKEPGFIDQPGLAARFAMPDSVVVTADGEYVVTDMFNHAVRVVAPGGAVRTLAGNGQPGFVDGQGADARFHNPMGLAVDVDGSILVTDCGNHAVRRVTMAGAVSTVAGNGGAGYADGEGADARFNAPTDVVVDNNGTIIVADCDNHVLRKIRKGQVTTLAGDGQGGNADGDGAAARFCNPARLALDERGRLLVVQAADHTVRVVDAALAPPAWMGPADAAEQERLCQTHTLEAQKRMLDYAIKADVEVVVRKRSFRLHQAVLSSRSHYFQGLSSREWQKGVGADGLMTTELKICDSYSDTQARAAFEMLARYIYYGDSGVLTCVEKTLVEAIYVLADYLGIASLTDTARGRNVLCKVLE